MVPRTRALQCLWSSDGWLVGWLVLVRLRNLRFPWGAPPRGAIKRWEQEADLSDEDKAVIARTTAAIASW
jgi:hypothetical protein